MVAPMAVVPYCQSSEVDTAQSALQKPQLPFTWMPVESTLIHFITVLQIITNAIGKKDLLSATPEFTIVLTIGNPISSGTA